MRDLRASAAGRGLALALAAALLGGCHSGGGGNGDVNVDPGTSTGTQSGPAPVYLSGTVAAGLPIAGASVQVKDGYKHVHASELTTADGSYQVNTYGMTGPLVVEARGMLAGKTVVLHSYYPYVPPGGSVLNVTPLTEAALALVTGQDPQDYFTGSATGVDFSLLTGTPAALGAASAALTGTAPGSGGPIQGGILSPVLNALGMTRAPNIFTDTLNTDRTGLDAVTELVDVNVLPQTGTAIAPQEQVQFTSRIVNAAGATPAQLIVTGSPGQAISTAASLPMSASDVSRINLQTLSKLIQGDASLASNNIIDGVNQVLAGNTTVSNFQNLFFDSDYLENGILAPDQAKWLRTGPNSTNAFQKATLSAPLIESCTVGSGDSTCRVRIAYEWPSTGTTVSAYAGQQGYFEDVVRNGPPASGEQAGLDWFFHGNQQAFRVQGHFFFYNRFLEGVTLPGQGITAYGLEFNFDFSKLAGSPQITAIDLYAVGGGGGVVALRSSTFVPSILLSSGYVQLGISEAAATVINENSGHIRFVATLSDSTQVSQDIFLPEAPATLAASFFPTLTDAVTSAFGGWDWRKGSFVGATGNPGILPTESRADIAVLGVSATIENSGGDRYDYVIGGNNWAPVLSESPVIFLNWLTPPFAFPPPAVNPLPAPYDLGALDRKLEVYAIDSAGSAYVTGYCYGAANCF